MSTKASGADIALSLDLPAGEVHVQPPDQGVMKDVSSPDLTQQTMLRTRIEHPLHLSSGHLASAFVWLKVLPQVYWKDDALAVAQKQVALLALPDRQPVPGTWSSRNGSKTEGIFTPKAPLVEGEAYLVHVTPTTLVKPERAKTEFWVGSMPRVTYIGFGSKQKNNVIDTLAIKLSESVPTASFAAATKVFVNGKRLQLTLVTQSTVAYVLLLERPGGFEVSQAHRITIAPDIGAPKKLDSQYKGKESTLPFELELTPNVKDTWTPPLSY